MKPGLDLPHFPGVRYETWTLPDPAGWDIDGIRELRDDIDARIQLLVGDLTTSRSGLRAEVDESTNHVAPGGSKRPGVKRLDGTAESRASPN